jgi:hypothetical protein
MKRKQEPEIVLKEILENFGRYARNGETLALVGENIQYDLIRDNQDPMQVGTLHDRQTFSKSPVIGLINDYLTSSKRRVSVTVDSLTEDLDDYEALETGYKNNNMKPYTGSLKLEFRYVKGVPVLLTDSMFGWGHLKI